jgi:hypothetical protein
VCHMIVILHMCANLERVRSLSSHIWGGPISGEKERWSLSLSVCLPRARDPSLVSLFTLFLFPLSPSLSLSLAGFLARSFSLSLSFWTSRWQKKSPLPFLLMRFRV